MKRTRVYVTGLGAVSPFGHNASLLWSGLLALDSSPTVRDEVPATHMKNRLFYSVPQWPDDESGKATAFAIHAAKEALADAGLVRSDVSSERIGVSLGTAMGDQNVLDHRRAKGKSDGDINPFNVAGKLASQLNCSGPNHLVSNACSAGAYAISIAYDAIQAGEADIMIVGGSDVFAVVPQACFNQMRALDPLICRPFDAQRAGTIGGEGAAILVIESEKSFLNRTGGKIYAELAGYGLSCDAHHLTAPDPSGIAIKKAMVDAMDHAELKYEDVDCIVVHGTGTKLNDIAEGNEIQETFHARGIRPWVYAPKSKLGHSGGASGAFAFLIAALMVDRQTVPPTANLTDVDTECALNFNVGKPLALPIRTVVCSSYAFGGNNVSIALTRSEHQK